MFGRQGRGRVYDARGANLRMPNSTGLRLMGSDVWAPAHVAESVSGQNCGSGTGNRTDSTWAAVLA